MTDGELVRQALSGVRSAGDELVRRWSARVLAFCHARTADRHAAEDLAQEALLRGLRNLRTLQSPERFGSWLCGIAVRVCLDWRKAKQTTQVPFTALKRDGDFDPMDVVGAAPQAEAAVDVMDPTPQQVEHLPGVVDVGRLAEDLP